MCNSLNSFGIVGFTDPPRPEAVVMIAQCRRAGIAVKMITGDHAATAAAIAAQLGLERGERAPTGAEPRDALPEERSPSQFGQTSLRAHRPGAQAAHRAGPPGRRRGRRDDRRRSERRVVKQADVGVAMGIKGTEAAKEAAEMVLLDDNFASIVAAVHEGRVVHDNIRKVVAWTLPTNGGVSHAIAPARPGAADDGAQILWVNLVAESALGLALAFEPAEPGVMRRPPRRPDELLLSRFLVWRVVVVSLLFAAASLGMFFAALELGRDLRDRAHHRGERSRRVAGVLSLQRALPAHDVARPLRGGARHAGGWCCGHSPPSWRRSCCSPTRR